MDGGGFPISRSARASSGGSSKDRLAGLQHRLGYGRRKSTESEDHRVILASWQRERTERIVTPITDTIALSASTYSSQPTPRRRDIQVHWPDKNPLENRRFSFAFALLLIAYLVLAGVQETTKKADVAIVFGSKVERDRQPSPRLRARLDAAYDL
jgi:hypothetical protein